MLLDVVGIEILNLKGFGKVLPQVVRGARLQGAAVPHHRFDAEGLIRPSKAFAL